MKAEGEIGTSRIQREFGIVYVEAGRVHDQLIKDKVIAETGKKPVEAAGEGKGGAAPSTAPKGGEAIAARPRPPQKPSQNWMSPSCPPRNKPNYFRHITTWKKPSGLTAHIKRPVAVSRAADINCWYPKRRIIVPIVVDEHTDDAHSLPRRRARVT
jgi:hypothetical protein